MEHIKVFLTNKSSRQHAQSHLARVFFTFILAAAAPFLSSMFLAASLHAETVGDPAPKILEPEARCPKAPLGEWTVDSVAEILGVEVARLEKVMLLRNLDLNKVCTMPSDKLARSFNKVEQPKPDHPHEWAKFRELQQSVGGVVKPDGLYQGFLQRQAIVQKQAAQSPGAPAPIAGISSGQWTSIGPGNIGGRIRAIAIHPSLPTTLFIGGVAGGIWKSVNSGASWAPVNDFMGNLAISSIVFDPTNSNTMYAGTGEIFAGDGVRGFGVFKSIDGGANWSLLNSTNPTTASSDWYYVNRIAISDGVVLAATRGGIYRSSDGGVTWLKATDSGPADIHFDPNNANNAVAGYWLGWVGYSRNAGLTWTYVQLNPSGGRVELAYAKSNTGTLYASVDVNAGALHKSIDGGATWSLVSTPAHLGGQGSYDNTIWVDPTNSSHIIVGGLDLKRSVNGGVSFSSISTWYYWPSSVHADHHAIVSDPGYNGSTNRKVYFGNDGGIYAAADISLVNANQNSNGWTSLNNNLAITQFYSGAGRATAGTRIIGGTQDNGSLFYSGTSNWGTFFGGDGGYSAIDSLDGNYLYGEYVYLSIFRSTTGLSSSPQNSTSRICHGITDGYADPNFGCVGGTTQANFIAPFILDPNNNNRMLAGGASLWVSNNVKATTPSWARIKSPVSTSININLFSYISAIAVAEGNSDIVWVGHNDGKVYRTTNGTSSSPTWTLVKPASSRMALRIVIDKDNPLVVYVTYGGYASNNVFKTTDGGSAWTDISGVLPSVPIRGFARYPLNANWLYAGTEVGVYASTDGGANWSAVNDGPANVSVDELFWFDDSTLVAATHGRGMFRTTITASNYLLAISRSGSGTVTSSSGGINCGSVCSASYTGGAVVTLTATPSTGSVFSSWGGACSGATATCLVTMSAAKSVTASFVLSGGSGSITGTSGNDTLTNGTGNNTVDGLAGIDTYVSVGAGSNYTLGLAAGIWTLTDRSGSEGTDTLRNIERLRFSNGVQAIDIGAGQTGGMAYRIYKAAFNRTPDNGGLKYWMGRMDTGTNVWDVAAGFISSPEFIALYGSSPTDADFITRVYSNVLGRAPDAGGYNFWLGWLSSGRTRAQLLVEFSESAENIAAVALSIPNGIWMPD